MTDRSETFRATKARYPNKELHRLIDKHPPANCIYSEPQGHRVWCDEKEVVFWIHDDSGRYPFECDHAPMVLRTDLPKEEVLGVSEVTYTGDRAFLKCLIFETETRQVTTPITHTLMRWWLDVMVVRPMKLALEHIVKRRDTGHPIEVASKALELIGGDQVPRVDLSHFKKDELTIGEKYKPAMEITDPVAAAQYFEACVQHTMRVTDLSREEAEKMERSNFGYMAGYYDQETRERVEELFSASHPIFGSVKDGTWTTDDIFRLAQRLGRDHHKKP